MNVYIDVQETILYENGTPAEGVHDFLEWITGWANCYWLTTYCKNGDLTYLHSYLNELLAPETFELIKTIHATKWVIDKTEAINFNKRWLEDSPTPQDILKLKETRTSECLVNVNLSERPYSNGYKSLLLAFDTPSFKGL